MPPEADTHWAYPAVSPDGRWIAATRWTEGLHDVVILDAHGPSGARGDARPSARPRADLERQRAPSSLVV